MVITDTHCHPGMIIEFEKNKNNTIVTYEFIIKEAASHDVQKIFCVSTERSDFSLLRSLAKTYPEFYFSLGIHPCDSVTHTLEDFEYLKEEVLDAHIKKEKIIAIGEIGIDCFHDSSLEVLRKQQEAFDYQLALAIEWNLPVIIHSRNAREYTLPILKKYYGRVRGVVHAFGGGIEEAREYVDLGFCLGIGGVFTYPKNRELREAVSFIGLGSLLLETDAPFLPIQAKRGKVNYPQYCCQIGQEVARVLGQERELVFEKIEETVVSLFFVGG
jgi:TatD DNase family protein